MKLTILIRNASKNAVYVIIVPLFFMSLHALAVTNPVRKSDFKTSEHPRVLITAADRPRLIEKMHRVQWAGEFWKELKSEIDPIVEIHQKDPGYVISRMQMHWEPGKHYTRFFANNNLIARREGNAKYPTVRVTYARPASGSTPIAPLDKILPYGDGSLPRLVKGKLPYRHTKTGTGDATLTNLGTGGVWEQVPFEKTGLGTETFNRNFVWLAWKSSLMYYFTGEKKYAKLAADIIWVFIRGAAQQEQVNPDDIGGDFVPNLVHPYMELDTIYKGKPISRNGYLSYETMGDTRHFATLPLAYDLIYDYLHNEYFDLPQFSQGIKGEEMWAPAHTEGKAWALKQFEIMFKRLIQNKIDRGGGLEGNWNVNEQQSAMLYALALDDDKDYADHKGREYYVNKLVYGPSTPSHGAYMDLWKGNINPTTGLWPEAPGGYGQNTLNQIITFGYIYYKNGLDMLSQIPQYKKCLKSTIQLLFPNYRIPGYGDTEHKTMRNDGAELTLAYATEKRDTTLENAALQVMKVSPNRNMVDEFYLPLFYYLDSIPTNNQQICLARTFYSEPHSLIMERNMGSDADNSLAFTLYGFGKKAGHRHPNGMAIELYGHGHIQGADQNQGTDYWAVDAHQYKANVAGHNTVSPGGYGASDDMPQDLDIIAAEPIVADGVTPMSGISPFHNFVDVANHFYTPEIRAEQRRMMSIVRTSAENGYYVDIFHSRMANGDDTYHDYIYHNMGIGAAMMSENDKPIPFTAEPLDAKSGKGYSYFHTDCTVKGKHNLGVDFNFGSNDAHMQMFIIGDTLRTTYLLDAEPDFRYYVGQLRDTRVPTVMLRQQGEAWHRPFIVVYEPYGGDTKPDILRVYTAATTSEEGVSKLTVEHKDGSHEDIIYALKPGTIIKYRDLTFDGRYIVAHYEDNRLTSVYVAYGNSLNTNNVSVKADGNDSFCLWMKLTDGRWKCNISGKASIKCKNAKIEMQ